MTGRGRCSRRTCWRGGGGDRDQGDPQFFTKPGGFGFVEEQRFSGFDREDEDSGGTGGFDG